MNSKDMKFIFDKLYKKTISIQNRDDCVKVVRAFTKLGFKYTDGGVVESSQLIEREYDFIVLSYKRFNGIQRGRGTWTDITAKDALKIISQKRGVIL